MPTPICLPPSHAVSLSGCNLLGTSPPNQAAVQAGGPDAEVAWAAAVELLATLALRRIRPSADPAGTRTLAAGPSTALRAPVIQPPTDSASSNGPSPLESLLIDLACRCLPSDTPLEGDTHDH